MNKTAYKRVIIKLSGEALSGGTGNGIDEKTLSQVVDQLVKVNKLGVEIGLIVGGGNFWRGRQGRDMDRSTADYMGMLATAINALGVQDALVRRGVPTIVQTALDISRVSEPFDIRKAKEHLASGKIVIFACGTGNPFFTTDTAAALRAAEIGAEVLLLAKNVDGIYTADPNVDKTAKKLDFISYKDILSGGLKAIDSTATALCMDRNIPILVFGLDRAENIYRAAMGENLGTVVSNG